MKNKIKNSIILGTLAVLLMHIINKIIFALSIMKDTLDSESGQYYEWRFGKIFYKKQGVGSPILLVHELTPYGSAFEWNELIKTLSKTHTVYTIDLLGCGRSDKPNITYTNYLYVQLLTDFIKQVIHHRTDVIATGVTSSFVVMACHNDDSIIDKIMIINPESINNLSMIPSKRTKILKLIIETPIIGTLVYNIIVNRKNIENVFIEDYLFNPFKLQAKYINAYSEAAHLGGANSKYLLSSIRGRYINTNIVHALKQINNSIFIVGGSEEKDIHNIVDNYLLYNNAIESVYLDNTKHFPHIECPSELLDHIQVFFYQRVDTL